MKNLIIVTGGAGFIGSNLIEYLLKKTKYKIISVDDYSSGFKKNHVISKRVNYINGNTKNIKKILFRNKKKIKVLFHFGEFSRIFQSFDKFNQCLESNTKGSYEVFNFCLENKIKLIYSATSASLGNLGKDKNLSPYAFSKAINLEFLENLKNWYNFKYKIIYFYNVYGKKQIEKGRMATVIGIFQNQFKSGQPITVVSPGTQSRRFTHISDTIRVCYEAWKSDKYRYYSISHKDSYTIKQVAKMFKSKIKLLPPRKGERHASALTNISFNSKVKKKFGKISLKDYISSFIKLKKI